MEENKLELNDKLYSFEGVIGRHGYFLNMVIICAISAIIFFPYMTYFYSHVSTIVDIFDLPRMFTNAPILLQLWLLVGSVGICFLEVSNIFRRLADIIGEPKVGTTVAVSSACVLTTFSFLMPFGVAAILSIVSLAIGLVLLIKRGKVTGAMPYDYRKEFNWGAFLGTWIWGLFNKSYIPLWQLLLWLTPLGLYFKLYCGLKGNEWAFSNKKCTDVQAFNKSQETQAIVFTILNFVVLPIVYFILIFAVIFALIFVLAGLGENTKNMTPQERVEHSQRIESNFNKFLDFMVYAYFERYEFTDDQNKFYVLDSDWRGADFKEKTDMLKLAATKSAEYRKIEYEKNNPRGNKSFSKYSEMPRTKIYSSETGKLLGEFIEDKNAMNSGSFKEAFTSVFKSFRFYNP